MNSRERRRLAAEKHNAERDARVLARSLRVKAAAGQSDVSRVTSEKGILLVTLADVLSSWVGQGFSTKDDFSVRAKRTNLRKGQP